jgi:hypothetical protein
MDGENIPAHENLEGEDKLATLNIADLKVTLRHGGTSCLA